MMTVKKRQLGFTLAELLIALSILGVIASFTIPKILNSQQDQRYNAIAKEAASAISGAYQKHVNTVGYNSTFALSELASYLNYLKRDTTSLIDSYPGQGSLDCSTWQCYVLANGATIAFDPGQTFGATDDLAITYFFIDPNGTYSGTTDGPDKSVCFFLYYGGRITSQEQAAENSHDVWGITYHVASQVGKDPTWFRW